MSNEFDPKMLRLTPEERLEIDEGATHGEYAENLITATLLKAADWIDSLEHIEDEDCKPCAAGWLVRALREAAGNE